MVDLPSVFVVRAGFGRYSNAFLTGNYVGIGWLETHNLSEAHIKGKDDIASLYGLDYPSAGNNQKGQNIGQIYRFLWELMPGSYVITPSDNRGVLLVGKVNGGYYYAPDAKESPYPHRKPIEWLEKRLLRSELSVPLQKTLGSSLTIFRVPQVAEVFSKLSVIPNNVLKQVSQPVTTHRELTQHVIEQMKKLSPDDFETLIKEILAAIGFDANKIGRVGDGGIDVEGVLDVYGFAQIELKVQVKRYSDSLIDHNEIKKFRGSVPDRAQAAYVTLSDFREKARQEAIRDGYKRVGLINGSQLVDLLTEHYEDLSTEMKNQLRLGRVLMPIIE